MGQRKSAADGHPPHGGPSDYTWWKVSWRVFNSFKDVLTIENSSNTVTETFSFGKPTIVLPMMGDQYDNAQRIQDKGFGRRLETYKFKEEELLDAVEKLINDEALKEKLQAAAKRIATSNSKVKACERIEALAEKYAK